MKDIIMSRITISKAENGYYVDVPTNTIKDPFFGTVTEKRYVFISMTHLYKWLLENFAYPEKA